MTISGILTLFASYKTVQLHLFSDKNYYKYTSPSLKRSYKPNGDGSEPLYEYFF